MNVVLKSFLKQLKDFLLERQAEDPDADRLAIVDERGQFIGEEYTLVLGAMAMLAQCGTLGAVRAQVDGGVEHGLLTNPHAVFNDGIYCATHGAVCANGALDFHFASTHGTAVRHTCLGFFHQAQLRCSKAHTHTQTRTAQEGAAIEGGQCLSEAAAQAVHKR